MLVRTYLQTSQGGHLPKHVKSTQALFAVDLKGPLAIVMGAEGQGMRRLTREACDALVKIPMLGVIESLNVSVATGVMLYEALRQRGG